MNDIYLRLATEYCERVGDEFYSEPVNAISNIAFFVSAFFVYRLLKKNNIKHFSYWFLFALLLLVGTGSLLYHTFRNPFTLALDAIPIYIFFLTFIYVLLERLTKSRSIAAFLLAGFFVVQILASYTFPTFLSGSIRHVVNGITFFGLIFWLHKKYARLDPYVIAAFFVYILAIVFRSIDNSICSMVPIGTHFLWHIFNATAVYFAIRALLNIDLLKWKS